MIGGDEIKQAEHGVLSIDRKKYSRAMAENLPVLRAKLGISQSELADMIGVTRQTLSSAECGSRELAWNNFISLLYIFTQNDSTQPLLTALGIYTPELASVFRLTDLNKIKKDEQYQR